jgi:hypothetical protein
MKRVIILILVLMSMSFVVAQEDPTVCCEETKTGFFCQDVPKSECENDVRQLPTSCESTSYCKLGTCYDSTEGTCIDNTPQLVCNDNDGIWNEEEPAQCQLGCCVLGDQAAFVTLVRCKKLSSFLGLATNYNTGIQNEVECVLTASSQEKGACIFEFEFENTCRFTTRENCRLGEGEAVIEGEFIPGKLCSAEELATNCGPTRETKCIPGKDEVYFVDSCGNPANIYDAEKINDKDYWGNVKGKLESCNPNSENANSGSCGNCNYLLGSYCREGGVAGAGSATYGENICADLNCKNTANGKDYRHGESWCVFDDFGDTGKGISSVGSRFYKHVCINGEEVLEQCADFRQEECTEDSIETTLGTFSQAACTVNRWQDCVSQTDQRDCENTDRRDCLWIGEAELFVDAEDGGQSTQKGACLPKNPPGLKFWEGEEARGICAQGNAQCIVTFEKDLFGKKKCKSNCHCLDSSWERQKADVCLSLGDCGPGVNWIGEEGYRSGYNVTIERFSGNRK